MSTPNVKRTRFTEEELRFIEQNYRFRSDKDIAHILGRQEDAITRQRDRHGWKKTPGRPTQEKIKEEVARAAEAGIDAFSFSGLTKEQRLEIYKENFSKNPRYPMLLGELHPEELNYYKHKYVDFIDEVDTITRQEEDALHHMIMADIYISRTRRQIRDKEAEHEEGGKPVVFGLYQMLENFEQKFIKYQQILRVTREGRLKEDKELKETFATMLQAYRSRLAKEEMGKQAALMDVYKNKCYDEMKSSRYLLGDTGV